MLQQVHHDHGGISTKPVKGPVGGHGRGDIAAQHLLEQGNGLGPVSQTQHVADNIKPNHLTAISLDNGLVQQG